MTVLASMAALRGRCSSGYCWIVRRQRYQTARLSLVFPDFSIRFSDTGAKKCTVAVEEKPAHAGARYISLVITMALKRSCTHICRWAVMIAEISKRIQQPWAGRQQTTDVVSGCHLHVDDNAKHCESCNTCNNLHMALRFLLCFNASRTIISLVFVQFNRKLFFRPQSSMCAISAADVPLFTTSTIR